ncbi:MAG: 3-dehydroquinate synthase II [Candidatus Hadarchaeales archaeon]
MHKLLWVLADWGEGREEKRPFILKAVEAGADAIVVKPEDVQEVIGIGGTLTACRGIDNSASISIVCPEEGKKNEAAFEIQSARKMGKKVAVLVTVKDKQSERLAVELGKLADYLLVMTPGWKVIPLENLIAELKGTVTILAGVRDAEEARLAVDTLEAGADGILLDPRSRGPEEIARVRERLDAANVEKVELVRGRVTLVKPVGLGDRACIDTTTLMEVGEGMLVGGQASGLFLVHSETLHSDFVEPRPFRVNAGAVHAYVLLPGGRTKYISELKAGDEVLIVNSKGRGRTAIVGRIKIERRPMTLVEVECGGEKYRTLLQNAETINLVSADGNPISVTRLREGDEVLMRVEKTGRHFGIKVDETIVER